MGNTEQGGTQEGESRLPRDTYDPCDFNSPQAVLSNAAAAQGLKALRAIKPLRMLTRSAGMRMVFKSIVLSLAAMANVSIVLIIFFFIFAILGTQLFMGLLSR